MTPGLRKVDSCVVRPHRCGMLPQLGANHRKGYFDTGQDDPELLNHQYVSVEFVELAARDLGWAGPETLAEFEAVVGELEREVLRLQAEVDEADRFAESAEYTLAHFGEKVRRKPGRPRSKEVADG